MPCMFATLKVSKIHELLKLFLPECLELKFQANLFVQYGDHHKKQVYGCLGP